MKAIFAFVYLVLASLVATSAWADSLDQMSFKELARFVRQQATAKDLSGLAQRQFYFEVKANYEAAADDYAEMQESLAEKIPNEFSRPVFDVRFIFGDKSSVQSETTIGILGGTGPLSDANITRLVINRLSSQDFSQSAMIHLFSLPPPRTTKDQILGGVLYSARLSRFLRHGYAQYFLASNTAHLNIGKLEVLAGSGRIAHLPRMIAEEIQRDQEQKGRETILILGTKQAWDGRLYASIFDEKGLDYVRPEADTQLELQRWIDKVKQGQLTSQERVQLKNFVAGLGTRLQARSLLLSCTELPLGLGELMGDLQDEGFTIHDSESMIADIIADEFQNVAN